MKNLSNNLFLSDKMLHLFGGNMTAYGTDTGGAVRDKLLTPAIIQGHLYATEDNNRGIGVYPIWQDNNGSWVKWGCCDIDTGDWDEAFGLATALNSMGIFPHIERSRSKGWHIWVFALKPVPAATMRRALKVAYAAIDLPAKEANPKQEALKEGQLGNYVRLPFKGGLLGPLERQVMMRDWNSSRDGEPVQVTEWFDLFDQNMRTAPSVLEHWASKWREPARQHMEGAAEPFTENDAKLLDLLPGDLYLFIKNGPRQDRSGGLVALAFKLKAAGFTPQEIYKVVDLADSRWGKYRDRANRELFLLDIVERTL